MNQSLRDQREAYSPHLRTAVIFTGTGTAGAYHAGVLRALQEAGVKIDIVAGCGMGVATALFAAIDASAQLSDSSSFWRSQASSRFYGVRPFLKFVGGCLAASLASVVLPLLAVVAGLLVFPAAFFLGMLGLSAGSSAAQKAVAGLFTAFEPGALPSVLPRVAVVGLAAALVAVSVEAWRARRRSRRRNEKGWFWRGLATPLDTRAVIAEWRRRLWRALAGGPVGRQPDDRDLSTRYTEVLADNLGQPGFRELLLVVHDLDARRDLVFGLLVERLRREFFGRREAGVPRSAEAFDLSGTARDALLDVLAASLSLPYGTDAHSHPFPVDGYWRGEIHRLTHRPESVARAIQEAADAGATQIVLVSAAPEPPAPHGRRETFVDLRSRIGEYVTSAEGAATRDTARCALEASRTLFVIQPSYNPLAALDFGGRYDALSDRHYALDELVQCGYEDAYRQFIEPVVAAGGEHLEKA